MKRFSLFGYAAIVGGLLVTPVGALRAQNRNSPPSQTRPAQPTSPADPNSQNPNDPSPRPSETPTQTGPSGNSKQDKQKNRKDGKPDDSTKDHPSTSPSEPNK